MNFNDGCIFVIENNESDVELNLILKLKKFDNQKIRD